MSALLAWFLSNPTILAIIAAVVGGLGWGFQQRRAGATAERNKLKAKEADAYAKHLKELEDAAAARAGVKPGKLPDDDPYRRD